MLSPEGPWSLTRTTTRRFEPSDTGGGGPGAVGGWGVGGEAEAEGPPLPGVAGQLARRAPDHQEAAARHVVPRGLVDLDLSHPAREGVGALDVHVDVVAADGKLDGGGARRGPDRTVRGVEQL